SVGIVPLGFTSHQSRFAVSYGDAAAATLLLDQLDPWREAFFERDNIRWVHAADEFHLAAGRIVPSAAHYDGFPQYENGIGLVRSFLDDTALIGEPLRNALAELRGVDRRVELVTGTLFAPVLREALEALDAPQNVRVLPAENALFGGNVSVAGLLTAQDIRRAIHMQAPGALVLVPDVVANGDGLLLDDVSTSDLAAFCDSDVRLISCDAGGLLRALEQAATNTPQER
ncbi:MAG: DUF512 domain-containing protein, partial [Actinomycetota bacterium]|nr:DUF512 domain-containing protein [Actinomycetota bacterium]